MMFLASTTPMLDGDFVMKALLLAVLVMQVVNGLMGWTRGKQAARRSVSFEGVPVDKAEHDRHIELLFNENKVLRETNARLNSAVEHLGQRFAHLEAKLDRFMERAIK